MQEVWDYRSLNTDGRNQGERSLIFLLCLFSAPPEHSGGGE